MSMSPHERRLWLIDASYLFNAQDTAAKGFRFDYRKLRNCLEKFGPIWRAYYLNSARQHQGEDSHHDSFHKWLQSAPPNGPKIITKIYGLKTINTSSAYCFDCKQTVPLTCPHRRSGEVSGLHHLGREQQKGVDVGLATLALTLQSEYSTLLLSSGDSDLIEAIDYLSLRGKHLELAVFKSGVSTDLQARADNIYWLDEHAEEIARD